MLHMDMSMKTLLKHGAAMEAKYTGFQVETGIISNAKGPAERSVTTLLVALSRMVDKRAALAERQGDLLTPEEFSHLKREIEVHLHLISVELEEARISAARPF
jgi:hypothetical protein